MSYERVNWENRPSTRTPVNATSLNVMDKGIDDLFKYNESGKLVINSIQPKNWFVLTGVYDYIGSSTSYEIQNDSLVVSGENFIGKKINIESDTDYILSCIIVNNGYIVVLNENDVEIGRITEKNIRSSLNFKTGEYDEYIKVYFHTGAEGTTSLTANFIGIQLEKGTEVTNYTIAKLLINGQIKMADTLYLTNDNYFDNDGDSSTEKVPRVSRDGMINIFNGHLRLFVDMDGDGDYDADIYSKDNMYLVCKNSVHLIFGQGEDDKTENYGRIVFTSTSNTNYIQTGKSYNGNQLKHLAFSAYRNGDYYMIFNKDTGYCGIGKYYSSPSAKLHVNSDENTLGIFENHEGTNARIGFKGTDISNNDCTIGCESKDLILRAGGEARLRCIADTKHVLPGIASSINLGSSSYPWKDIFSVNSLSVISDKRKKKEIKSIDEKVFEAWSHIEYKQYKLKTGDDKIHFGIIAQDIIEEFKKVGLNALDYGLIVYDEESDTYNVRYDEVNILENAYMRRR